MRNVTAQELTLEHFNEYGAFAAMVGPQGRHLGAPPIEFYRDLLPLNLGRDTIASFSICHVEPRPLVVDRAEFHTRCGEGILPLNGDVLIHVGPATRDDTPPVKDFAVFRVPRGTMVALKPGIWHHAPFALGAAPVDVLIVLPERTYANDCVCRELAAGDRLKVHPS